MATLTINNGTPANTDFLQMFQVGATLTFQSATSVTYTNPSGTKVVIDGVNFAFGLSGPTTGAINRVRLFNADQTVLQIDITGLNSSLPLFHTAWFGTSGSAAGARLMVGNDILNGSNGNDSLLGVLGADTINAGDGNDYIDPDQGADTINGGAGLDMLSYAWGYASTKTGLKIDLTGTTVVDPWGFTDTFSSIEGVRATRFADTLVGNAADNQFEPLGGADVVNGGTGLDRISFFRDAQYGGTAGITVNLQTGTATDGFGAKDTLTSIESARGTDKADSMTAGNGLLAGGASWELFGQAGDDTLIAGTGDLYVEPGAGNDSITGGAGSDQISYAEYTGVNGTLINFTTGIANDPYGGTDTFKNLEGARGTKNVDTIIGDAGNNYFRGLAGADYLDGGLGSDEARYDRDAGFGGTGVITVNLLTGKATDGFGAVDTLVSIEGTRMGAGADTFIGDAGRNFVRGFAGADMLNGGLGQDQVLYDLDASWGGALGAQINLKTGTAIDGFGHVDTLISIERARGTAVVDTWQGGDTALTNGEVYEFQGLDGADQITGGAWDIYVEPGAGNDVIKGGTGFDQVSYAEYTGASGAVFNFTTGVVNDPYGNTDTMTGVEAARGTKNADSFIGNGFNNMFRGLGGADTFNGGGGLDEVRYDRDAEYGGGKAVSVDLTAGNATDGFGTIDTLIAIEDVRGSQFADTILGSAGSNVLRGMAGADLLDGKGGVDTVNYSSEIFFGGTRGVTVNLTKGTATDGFGATDTLVAIENIVGTENAHPTFIGYSDHLTGSAGNNRIEGRGGNDIIAGKGGADTLLGDAGNDYLSGEAGTDTLIGGAGNDILSGGLDADIFQVDLAALVGGQGDMITDLLPGTDSILMPLAFQAQTLFVDGALLVSLGGGQTYSMTVLDLTAAEIQAATKFA